jgi:hypothetical protein
MAGMHLLTLGARATSLELHPDGRRLAIGVAYPDPSPARRVTVLSNLFAPAKR